MTVSTLVGPPPPGPDGRPVGTPDGTDAPIVASGEGFGVAYRMVRTHPFVTDAIMGSLLLALVTGWAARSPVAMVGAGVLQAALVVPLVWRRRNPTLVFALIAVIALIQWLLDYRLVADVSLLVALYTVAVHDPYRRVVGAAVVLELGVLLASARWSPAGSNFRSFIFLSAMVVAAVFVGLTVRAGSAHLSWLTERAECLELERDQQATIVAAAERAHIAREMHDVVTHSLSVVVNLADAASVVSHADPQRASDAMGQVAEVGRRALADMRTIVGVLGTDDSDPERRPQPNLAQLDELFDQVRATGLAVSARTDGEQFPIGAAAELTIYRIVQECLTNTIKHGSASCVQVTLRFTEPLVELRVADDGTSEPPARYGGAAPSGHGLNGMRERAALHGGVVRAGPAPEGGWMVSTALRLDGAEAP
jgi:signal transduction histidine kinase